MKPTTKGASTPWIDYLSVNRKCQRANGVRMKTPGVLIGPDLAEVTEPDLFTSTLRRAYTHMQQMPGVAIGDGAQKSVDRPLASRPQGRGGLLLLTALSTKPFPA